MPATTAILVVATALCVPAFYNGYPLVFSDTAAYIWAAAYSMVPDERPIAYGVFLRLTGWRWSLWPSIAAQTVLCALALWITLRSYAPTREARHLVWVGLALALATPFAWFASQVMPDVLTPLAILGAFVLLVRWRYSAPVERVIAAGLVVLACAAHSSTLLLTGALSSLAIIGGLLRREAQWLRGGLRTAATLAAACALVLAVNYRQTGGELFLARGGHTFLLGRLVESKVLPRLLADRCGRTDYILCPYRHQLGDSLEYFMFHRASPIHKFGGTAYLPKGPSMRMVKDAVRYYPGAVLGASVRNSARQFVTFYTGDGLHSYDEFSPRFGHVVPAVRTVFPNEYAYFAASRQQRETLPLAAARVVHAVTTWATIAASALVLVLALRARRQHGEADTTLPAAADLHAFVWVATALNAAICATLTTVTDRFQARVVWLFAFACLVTLIASGRGRRDVIGPG